jgi:hypothetical protein
MRTKKISVVVLALLAIACSYPLVTQGKTENLPNHVVLSPEADNPIFLPSLSMTDISTVTPSPTTVPIPSSTPVAPSGNAIIADHNVISWFSSIPETYLDSAATIQTLFMHQSTGDNIDYLGLKCLAGLREDPERYPQECLTYALHPYDPYDDRNWDWEYWPEHMSDAILKTDRWVTIVNERQQDYQVLGMKLCYVDSWNLDFEYYREKMDQLENTYPEKIFIWSTSALIAESMGTEKIIHDFNQELRAYALANDKILYDLAAIESHDSDGNICHDNGIEALCEEYYTGFGGGGGGHPNVQGSIRLAKGFWWLMARIAGWDGAQE